MSEKIINLGNKMGDLLDEITRVAVEYEKWWRENMVEKTRLSIMPNRTPVNIRYDILQYVRNLIQKDRDAMQEAFDLLKDHPTNRDTKSAITKPEGTIPMSGRAADSAISGVRVKG